MTGCPLAKFTAVESMSPPAASNFQVAILKYEYLSQQALNVRLRLSICQIHCCGVNVNAGHEQHAHNFQVTIRHSKVQSGFTICLIIRPGVRVSASSEQQAD